MSKYSVVSHLSKENIIKNGSFFTPKHITKLVHEMIKPYIKPESIIMDMGSGYGAFIEEFDDEPNILLGTEFDEESFSYLVHEFPQIKFYHENSLVNVNRKKYNILESEDLIIIGNPPYNDITSQYKKGQKGSLDCDEDIKTRDFGITFLKAYNKLAPKYACVLHPLAYLIKKTNFNSLKEFKQNYKLIDATIFSSKEFETILKSNSDFPVVAGLYVRDKKGMTYEYVRDFKFNILNTSKDLVLSNILTIDGIVDKYPSKNKKCNLQFYTLRDMNALIRNASFVDKTVSNGVDVSLDDLYKYSWLFFIKKNFAPTSLSFIYGNLSPLYSMEIERPDVKNSLVSYAYNNSELVRNSYSINEIQEKYGVLNNSFDELFKILSALYM